MARPTFKPTKKMRDDVRLLKADSWSHDRIARYLNIARNTLEKHFMAELEDGADHVRAMALRNLAKASNRRNVAASKELLKIVGFVAPSSKLAGDDPEPAKPALGKKEQARIDAMTAGEGTPWDKLIN